MSVSIGIIGLPNVGKSTLFNALTHNNVLAANYPFATIEPNTGTVPVPDKRLDVLAKLYNTQKIVPATVTFLDIAGLVAGASKGEGLGNQFLGHIRTSSAMIEVVRAFSDTNITHVGNQSDTKKDIEIINTELILADLQSLEKKLPRLEKEARADPKLRTSLELLNEAQRILNSGNMISSAPQMREESAKGLEFISAKPIIYLFNTDEETIKDEQKKNVLKKLVSPAPALFICAKLENELKDLDEADASELLLSYGQEESGLIQLIHAAYDMLGLQSFLTAGEKEVRAWTIAKGTTAQEAAGVIHTDFSRGFIAAEIVSFEDLVASGSLVNARAAGKVRTEGKSYIMQPDDIVEFRFNV